ncbi:hypothetical protein GCM10027087_00930 [Paractinoplanes abujensis]
MLGAGGGLAVGLGGVARQAGERRHVVRGELNLETLTRHTDLLRWSRPMIGVRVCSGWPARWWLHDGRITPEHPEPSTETGRIIKG